MTQLNTGEWEDFPCVDGYNYNYPLPGIVNAYNLCGTRVWLHQYPNPEYKETGWAFCIGPYDEALNLSSNYADPDNIQISSNTNSC